MFEYKPAKRTNTYLRVAISGPSGSGKTMSALLLAFGITGDWGKIAVIDTENESASLYEHLGPFNVVPFPPPYSPERYIEAINFCAAKRPTVIIIDTASQEWNGEGGILSDNKENNDSFFNWKYLTPRHEAFVNTILHSPCHTIVTFRTDDEYIMTTDEKTGKAKPVKMGLKAITRKGWEYDNTVVFRLDDNLLATVTKDRTTKFTGVAPFMITSQTGRILRDWAGTVPSPETLTPEQLNSYKQQLADCNSLEDLKTFKAGLTEAVLNNQDFIKLAINRYQEITKKVA